jgi:hypothetical protein
MPRAVVSVIGLFIHRKGAKSAKEFIFLKSKNSISENPFSPGPAVLVNG